MGNPVIYLAAVASGCRKMLDGLGCADTAELLSLVQASVGESYRVEGDASFIELSDDDAHGGRDDDEARARVIEQRLADDQTVAFVALRGGAWLARILPRIDFTVLERRTQPIALFGFSELTTLLNIASAYPQAFCLYDLGPGFLRMGLKDQARRTGDPDPEKTADARFREEFAGFFRDVTAVLEGRGSSRRVEGALVAGTLPNMTQARFVGGNLAVLTALVGTPYAKAIDLGGRWLMIEDINELPERVDRYMAHFKLAGMLEGCSGVLVGDFHEGQTDHQAAVVHLLRHHLPVGSNLPIITTRDLGHIWPLAPLPLNVPVRLETLATREGSIQVSFGIDWPTLVTPASA
ncbi:MAG: LD-carboxypeptidase [bacterium]|nr:LD-carboxypeptidase [bacterium]